MNEPAPASTELTYPFAAAPAPGEAHEVAPGVRWLRMRLPMAGLNHINLWAIADGPGWTLVDTGMQTAETVTDWQTALAGPLERKPVQRVVVHPHAPGPHRHGRLADARSACACGRPAWSTSPAGCWWPTPDARRPLMAWTSIAPPAGTRRRSSTTRRASAASARRCTRCLTATGAWWTARSSLIGGHRWRVVVGRGHSPEHACLHCPQLKLLISGDQVLPRITSNVSVFPTEPDARPAHRLAAVARLAEAADPG